MKQRKRIRTRMKMAKLDNHKAYIVQIMLDSNTPREAVKNYVNSLSEKLKFVGLKKFTVLPVFKDDRGKLTFFEIEDTTENHLCHMNLEIER